MRLLLTNDDGAGSEGITELADVLAKKNDVWIVAPDSNQSGVSHCITLKNTMRLQETGPQAYKYSGTPVDCVIAGLRAGILPEKPDAVISGINKGANIGTDILYSGTAAAAGQAVLYGVPGIALSIDSDDETWQYRALADFAAKNLEQLISLCSVAGKDGCMPETPCVFVNVNAGSATAYKGVKCTGISFREYHDSIDLKKEHDRSLLACFTGGHIVSSCRGQADYDAVRNGFVSVSRVYAEPVSAGIVDGIAFSL